MSPLNSARLSQVYLTGLDVNITVRSNDADFILEGNEFDLPWRTAVISLAHLALGARMEAVPAHSQYLQRFSAEELKSLIECSPPLLMQTKDGQWHFLDGTTRTACAHAKNLGSIRVLLTTQQQTISAEEVYQKAHAAGNLPFARQMLIDYAAARGFESGWYQGGPVDEVLKNSGQIRFLSSSLSHAQGVAAALPEGQSVVANVLACPGRVLDLTNPAVFSSLGLTPAVQNCDTPSIALRLDDFGPDHELVEWAKEQGYGSIQFFSPTSENRGAQLGLAVLDPARAVPGVSMVGAQVLKQSFPTRADGTLLPLSALIPELSREAAVEEELQELARLHGRPLADRNEVLRSWDAGARILAFHDMDEEPVEVRSLDMLNAYAPDQMLAIPISILRMSDAERAPTPQG